MIDTSQYVEGYKREAKEDYIGLWQISRAAETLLGSGTDAEIQSVSLQICRDLIDAGLAPGDYTKAGFHVWPGSSQDWIRRIAAEWPVEGRPTLGNGDYCWFALNKS